jgi:hypothetical protein
MLDLGLADVTASFQAVSANVNGRWAADCGQIPTRRAWHYSDARIEIDVVAGC